MIELAKLNQPINVSEIPGLRSQTYKDGANLIRKRKPAWQGTTCKVYGDKRTTTFTKVSVTDEEIRCTKRCQAQVCIHEAVAAMSKFGYDDEHHLENHEAPKGRDEAARRRAKVREARFVEEAIDELAKLIVTPRPKGRGRPMMPWASQFRRAMLSAHAKESRLCGADGRFKDDSVLTSGEVCDDYNGVSRTLNRDDFTDILERMISISGYDVCQEEDTFATDGTNLYNRRCDESYEVKMKGKGTSREPRYTLLMHMVGTRWGVAAAAGADCPGRVPNGTANGEKTLLVPLIAQLARIVNPNGTKITGDKGHSFVASYRTAERLGFTPYFPPPSSHGTAGADSDMYTQQVALYHAEPKRFLAESSKHQTIEGYNKGLKFTKGNQTRSKNRRALINEVLMLRLLENLTKTCEWVEATGGSVDYARAAARLDATPPVRVNAVEIDARTLGRLDIKSGECPKLSAIATDWVCPGSSAAA